MQKQNLEEQNNNSMNKKIILSISAIAAVAAIAISGTVAYFSDTETSTGNTFTAGTLDLKIDGGDWTGAAVINVGPIKPGDTGTATGTIKNSGTINASSLTFTVTNQTSHENGCNEAEKADESSCESDNLGELCSALNVVINYDGAEKYSGPLSDAINLSLGALNAGVEKNYSVSYTLPSSTNNRVQSDDCVFTMTATLNQ